MILIGSHKILLILKPVPFSIFVFAPDDTVRLRGQEFRAVRDNVVFELGLFTGKNGRERTFIICPRNVDLHLPTDLLGLTPVTYDGSIAMTDDDARAIVGPACTKLKRAIRAAI